MATRTISKPRGRPNNRFGDRRIEVLRAAANIFSDLGFRQATLEDVARELGITRAALYPSSRSTDAPLPASAPIARPQLHAPPAPPSGPPPVRARLHPRSPPAPH